MTRLNYDRHPISLVSGWAEILGDGWEASLSKYTYVPHSIEDKREIIRVELQSLSRGWLTEQIDALSDSQELAFHSLLSNGRRIRHVPMVDFAPNRIEVEEVSKWTKQFLGSELVFFNSGRSFHAYGRQPISQTAWLRLMGRLLLSNSRNQESVVDTRWVGHRLLAGYSSLRWSNNSGQYKRMPERM